MQQESKQTISPSQFSSRFIRLIFYAWLLPPIFGFSFLVWIKMFTLTEVRDILLSPLESLFILANMGFALWFFRRYAIRIRHYLESPSETGRVEVTRIIQKFPLAFWGVFLAFLAMAPGSVMLAAELYANYDSQPIDWFRIHLVAVIVSIVVGLPIFYLIFDLFGVALSGISLERPVLTIRTKVFLIGSLIPLLIDTLLVQYFWTRTGFFTFETFGVWLALELAAIYGTLIFVRSFGQSLRPFEDFVLPDEKLDAERSGALVPASTDELGVLVNRFRTLLEREQALEAQLLHAQKLEAVGRLAGGVAHDFNNDLTAILGYAELIRDQLPTDDPLAHYAEAIITATNRSSGTAQSLLTFSRRRDIRVEPVDMNKVIEDFSVHLGRLMGKGIEITTQVCERSAVAMIDRAQIEQALLNLCLNARDAMPEGGQLTVSASCERFDRTGHVTVSVSDTGEGIDEAHRQKIFEPFFTTKADGMGTGLGLSMVYGIATAHDGSIRCDSTPGGGATFSITLPLSAEIPGDEPVDEPFDHTGSETILLAEDNNAVRSLLTAQLENFGYRVVEARDGADAIRQFEDYESKIDVAVLDFRMPKRDGFEVFKKVRERKPTLPVIFMTGDAGELPQLVLSDHGDIPIVNKPFSGVALHEEIQKLRDA